jgi:hypothetical protein
METSIRYVNEHRAAVGRSDITDPTPDQLERHLELILEHAPYGNDPWEESEGSVAQG